MATTPPEEGRTHSAVRDYTLVCLAALLLLAVVLVQEGLGWRTLIPVVVGALALVGCWASGPPVLLLTTAALLVWARTWWYAGWYRPADSPVTDLVLALALLGYTAGHYRLQGLVTAITPPDRRRKALVGQGRNWFLTPPGKVKRSPGVVRPSELGALLVAVPLFGVLASLVWLRVSIELSFPQLGLSRAAWQVVMLVWLVGLGLAATAAVLAYLGWTQASREEALQYLQDQLWAGTRREQRRIARWLTWARLRVQRRRERKEGV
jgi:hypothetical protein